MSLKKSDIAKNITLKTNISNSVSKNIANHFFDLIKSESNVTDVKVANFGTFSYKITPQRIGRNPKTNEEHVITERVKLKFVVSNKVKDQLN